MCALHIIQPVCTVVRSRARRTGVDGRLRCSMCKGVVDALAAHEPAIKATVASVSAECTHRSCAIQNLTETRPHRELDRSTHDIDVAAKKRKTTASLPKELWSWSSTRTLRMKKSSQLHERRPWKPTVEQSSARWL